MLHNLDDAAYIYYFNEQDVKSMKWMPLWFVW
jgi:hypothetical protein